MTREEFMQEFVDRLNMIKNDMDVSCLDIEREAEENSLMSINNT